MKDIKFRFVNKRKDSGKIEFQYSSIITLDMEDSWQGSVPYTTISIDLNIGLQDLNGKDIYVGDIIKDEYNSHYVIVFEDGCFYGQYKDREMDADINPYHEESIIEVIGNIYQNPELL